MNHTEHFYNLEGNYKSIDAAVFARQKDHQGIVIPGFIRGETIEGDLYHEATESMMYGRLTQYLSDNGALLSFYEFENGSPFEVRATSSSEIGRRKALEDFFGHLEGKATLGEEIY